jgi:signal transduction histidine kinase/CHASE1-domain containing sensor protein
MRATDLSALTLGRPATWVVGLPLTAANLLAAGLYLFAATALHLVFALPHALPAAGSAASGFALAIALLCGPKVLPGLWAGRFLWELCLTGGTSGALDAFMAAAAATSLALQTELARRLTLALKVLPTKLRRLRKTTSIALIGLMSSAAGAAVHLAVMGLVSQGSVPPHATLQAAAILLPEWAGIAIVFPLFVLWLQDDDWRETRKRYVSLTVGLAIVCSLALTWLFVRFDSQLVLHRLQDSNTAAAKKLEGDLRSAHLSIEILKSHLRVTPHPSAAQFNEVALAIRAGSSHLQALSWNPVILHPQRSAFEARLRREYGSEFSLRDRTPDGTLVSSSPADFYVAVEHIAPLAENRPAVGLNIHANPARRAAIQEAMQTGKPTITPRIQLAQETGKSWGALYLSPLYRSQIDAAHGAAPEGFAVAVLRMEDIVGKVVGALRYENFERARGDREQTQVVRYRFVDLNAPAESETLFEDSAPVKPPQTGWLGKHSLFSLDAPPSVRQPMPFGGRTYALESAPLESFWSGELSATPFIALGVGLTLTWVALAASLLLTGSTQLLTMAVDRRTQQIQEAESALQATNLRLEQQSLQLRSVLEAGDTGYMGFDADGVLVLSNEKGFELIAMSDGEERESYLTVARHIGQHFQLAQSQSSSVTQSLLNVRIHGESHIYPDLVPIRPEGTARYLDLRVFSFHDPDLNTLVLLHDTTPELQLERAKSQFISFAAHEIRTPLTVIHGYAALLANRTYTPDKVQDLGAQMLRKSGELNQLLQRMLDLSELDMNGLDPQRTRATDLGALCAETARLVNVPDGRNPPIMEHHDPIPWCRVDAQAISMALNELLINAYAFSSAGSDVTVSVGPMHGDPDAPPGVRIQVIDRGQGMPPDVQEHIFERFYRADSSGKNPGFGLGLSTVKLIAGLHNAQLHIDSTPGLGTVVSMDIPRGDI